MSSLRMLYPSMPITGILSVVKNASLISKTSAEICVMNRRDKNTKPSPTINNVDDICRIPPAASRQGVNHSTVFSQDSQLRKGASPNAKKHPIKNNKPTNPW